jgi:putative membrane protein
MTMYLWLKAFHIIFVVTWFAGLFYMPRLFVYHASATDDISRERFKIMQSKLYRIIMNPSMIATLVLGIWLLVESWQAYSVQIWIWLKIFLVLLLIGYHHYCLRIIKAFADDRVIHSEKFFRIFNELPSLVLIVAVILVVVKPF